MNFRKAAALEATQRALASTNARGGSDEEIGSPLDHGVLELLPAYERLLGLSLDPSPAAQRSRIMGVRWDRVEREASRLDALAAALDEVASAIGDGLGALPSTWDGPTAQRLRNQIGRLLLSLRRTSASLRHTAHAIEETLLLIRAVYGAGSAGGYRRRCERLFLFQNVPKPHEIYRLDPAAAGAVAPCGPRCHNEEAVADGYGDPSARRAVAHRDGAGRLIVDHWFYWYSWESYADHEGDLEAALRESHNECFPAVPAQIDLWYHATDTVRETVTELYECMLDVLKAQAGGQPFCTLTELIGPWTEAEPESADA